MQYYRTQFRRDLLTVVLSSALARLEDPWDFSEQELDLIISIKKKLITSNPIIHLLFIS